MNTHIQCFADFLNSLEYKKLARLARAKGLTRQILALCDSSDDVPGDITALISAALAEAANG